MSDKYIFQRDGWIEGISHCSSPNKNNRPDNSVVDLLIIHNISLPPGEFGGGYIDQLFTNQLSPTAHSTFKDIAELKVSCHFLIDRFGAVTQYVSVNDRAWHAGVSSWAGKTNCNDNSVGIELEGSDFTHFTDDQYRVLAQLAKSIIHFFPSIKNRNIVGHSDVAAGRKTDPGPYFDWQRFRESIL